MCIVQFKSESETKKKSPAESSEEISDIDAKVLQSLLAENIDLATEERYKTILRRSNDAKLRRQREEIDRNNQERAKAFEEEKKEEYSSTIFKTAMNWDEVVGSLQAKAERVLEKVKLVVKNRVERDLKLAASLGLFALDRAMKDSGRALGAAKERTVFLLSEKSSYEGQVENTTSTASLFEDMNTPLDEIKLVTQSIKDILSGNTVDGERSRVIKSVAPAGSSKNAERLRRAYQRRKETVFKREKESIDAKIGRTAGAITDAAWELKSEIGAEGNRAGYRSEALRGTIKNTTTAMLQGKIFENLMPQKSEDRILSGLPTSFLEKNPSESSIENDSISNILDVSVETLEPNSVQNNQQQKRGDFTSSDLSSEEVSKVNDGGEEVNYFEAFLSERARFTAAIRVCLEYPEETWLSPGLINKEESEIDGDALGDAITAMVFARDEYESEINEDFEMSFYRIIQDLEALEKATTNIFSLVASAVGVASAERFKEEVTIGLNWSSASMVAHKRAKEAPPAVDKPTEDSARMTERVIKESSRIKIDFTEPATIGGFVNYGARAREQISGEDVVELDIGPEESSLDYFLSEAEDNKNLGTRKLNEEMSPVTVDEDVEIEPINLFTDVDVIRDGEPTVDFAIGVEEGTGKDTITEVELIVDDDGIDIDASAVEEVKEKTLDSSESLIVTIILRTLDILLFIGEKSVIGIPRIIVAGTRFISQVNKVNQGAGESIGWKLLENVQNGKDRY